MRKTFFVMLFCGLACSLFAQEPKEKDRHRVWKVQKEYDENGNLIKYDSVYSYASDPSTLQYSQEMLDSLFRDIPKMLDPISRDMAEFFQNDPFFSQIFGSDSLSGVYSEPFNMSEFEQMLRKDSLWIEEADVDQLLDEMDRLRQEFMRKLRGQPKVPEKKQDSLR